MDLTKIALNYLDRGWSVLPVHVPAAGGCSCGKATCSWPGKHPRIAWRDYTQRLPTRDEVGQWFREDYYGSNIGIVTGRVSGLAVIDVDGPRQAYAQLKLPRTLEAITGGGGRHYYYRCKEPMSSRIGLVSGVDLKSEGGFVVVPPSIHRSGRRYLWRWTVRPALLDPAKLPGNGSRVNEAEWYDGLLVGVHEGERSITTARLTGRYAQLGLTPKETLLLISGWNEANVPPLSQQELRATIRAVYRKHESANGSPIESAEDLYQLFRGLTGRGRRRS